MYNGRLAGKLSLITLALVLVTLAWNNAGMTAANSDLISHLEIRTEQLFLETPLASSAADTLKTHLRAVENAIPKNIKGVCHGGHRLTIDFGLVTQRVEAKTSCFFNADLSKNKIVDAELRGLSIEIRTRVSHEWNQSEASKKAEINGTIRLLSGHLEKINRLLPKLCDYNVEHILEGKRVFTNVTLFANCPDY